MAAANKAEDKVAEKPGVDMRTHAPMSTTVAPQDSVKISVGCKLPHGIHMDIRKIGESTVRFTLKGTNSLRDPEVVFPIARSGGFAITHGVPKEFFEAWMHENRFHAAVRNNLIFAHAEPESVMAMGRDLKDVKNGLDPLDPRKTVVGGVQSRTEND